MCLPLWYRLDCLFGDRELRKKACYWKSELAGLTVVEVVKVLQLEGEIALEC